MKYLVLWSALLAATLLFVAAATAWAARRRKVTARRLWSFLAAGLAFLFLSVPTGAAYLLYARNIRPAWLFPFGLLLTVAHLFGALLILRAGLKVLEDGPIAGDWPRGRLTAAFGLSTVFCLAVFLYIDLGVRVETAEFQTDLTWRLAAFTPGRPADADNAARLYRAAADALGPESGRPEWLWKNPPADFNPFSPEAARIFKEKSNALALIHQAVRRPYFQPDPDVLIRDGPPSAYQMEFDDLARLLTVESRARAQAGDPDGAVRVFQAMNRLADHLYGWPDLASFLIAGKVEAIYISELEFFLARTPDPPPDLILKPIRRPGSLKPLFLDAMAREGLFMLRLMTMVETARGPTLDEILNTCATIEDGEDEMVEDQCGGSMTGLLWRVFFLPSDLKSMDDRVTNQVKAMARPFPEAIRELERLADQFETDRGGLLTSAAFPGYAPYLVRAELFDARRRLVVLAMACTAYKMENGRYPDRLEALVPHFIPALPEDPFTGGPLTMEKVEGGLALKSAGTDAEKIDYGVQPPRFYLGREAYDRYRVQGTEGAGKGKEGKK